ncbi:gamma-glutamyl-gamma-aminobutyrate hydrolase family protein [Nakamurella sp. GG22]
MTRPLIGITTYREPATWGRWDRVDATLLPAAYTDAVRGGGGTPLLIPPLGIGDQASAIVARLDGLVISGGSDVNPSRYSAEPGPWTINWRDERDVSEMALLDAADDIGLPVLGICRGMQLMAVTAGGSLLQHVPDVTGSDRHSPGPDIYGAIEVRTEPGSRLAGIIGDAVTVACHHHQVVVDHPGFVAVATADDGLLEAMETPGDRFRLGVQWHPETQADRRLFEALAAAAGQWRQDS